MKTISAAFILLVILASCQGFAPAAPSAVPTTVATETQTPFITPSQPPTFTATVPLPTSTVTLTPTSTSTPSPSPTPFRLVPDFSHIIIIVLENKEISRVIGKDQMPTFDQWAQEYTLLTGYFAVTHPSLPNYLAMIGGDTFGINSDCELCYVKQTSLPDLIEASGRTWKAYQEDMPSPCYIGSKYPYAQTHNPFIYFDAIRLDAERCKRSIVPLTQLTSDLAANTLPNLAFITPNVCNDAHNCGLDIADAWLKQWVGTLMSSSSFDSRSLIIVTFDEGGGNGSCCGIAYGKGGGQIATVLISPLAKPGFQDNTPYTHYSLLKMILAAWDLPELRHTADAKTTLITAPWH